jgi:hypothetical protein
MQYVVDKENSYHKMLYKLFARIFGFVETVFASLIILVMLTHNIFVTV